MKTIGIIGGSGIYTLDSAKRKKLKGIEYLVREQEGKKVVFLPRHGMHHQYLASEIPHEKNFSALKKENIEGILAFSSVGCLDENVPIQKGNFIVPNDYLRGFSSRIDFLNLKNHPDMSEPFDKSLREKAIQSIKNNSYGVVETGTYVYSGGNCFETKTEIAFLKTIAKLSPWVTFSGSSTLTERGLVVGLTAVPEIILAKEYQIPYALVCIPVNYGTGMKENPTHEQTLKMIRENEDCIKNIIATFLKLA